jgi:hypothetical protein
MAYQGALAIDSEQRSETERQVVDATEALVVETVKLLSRGCPPEILAEAACEDVLALKPHLEEALEALEGIKGHRSLTDRERSQQYAFRMLLACRG